MRLLLRTALLALALHASTDAASLRGPLEERLRALEDGLAQKVRALEAKVEKLSSVEKSVIVAMSQKVTALESRSAALESKIQKLTGVEREIIKRISQKATPPPRKPSSSYEETRTERSL